MRDSHDSTLPIRTLASSVRSTTDRLIWLVTYTFRRVVRCNHHRFYPQPTALIWWVGHSRPRPRSSIIYTNLKLAARRLIFSPFGKLWRNPSYFFHSNLSRRKPQVTAHDAFDPFIYLKNPLDRVHRPLYLSNMGRFNKRWTQILISNGVPIHDASKAFRFVDNVASQSEDVLYTFS